MTLRKFLSVALIAVAAFSVAVCAHAAFVSMGHMEGHADMSEGHVAHAQSLIQATVPAVILFTILIVFALAVASFFDAITVHIQSVYVALESPPPRRQLYLCRTSSPRSPPRY